MLDKEYVYHAIVRSVYDGDTLRLDIDLGFDSWLKNVCIRLYGINTPEIKGPTREAGLKSRDWLMSQIPIGSKILIKTERDSTEKYGRYLASLYLNGINLNQEMLKLKLAVKY